MNGSAFPNSSLWRKRPARRCGLECGASGSKLVLLTSRRSETFVDRVFLDEEPYENRVRGLTRSPLEMARRALINRNLEGSRTTFIPEGAARSCFTLLPKMHRTDAEGALLLQAQKALSWDKPSPVVAHDDSVFQRDRIGSVVALGDWKETRTWCGPIEGAGGVLEDVTVRACAYEALARHQRWADTAPVALVADVGATSTCFYILDRGRVRFLREIPVAGNAITKALTTEISTDKGPVRLTDIEAEEFKTAGGAPGTADRPPVAPPIAIPWSVGTPAPHTTLRLAVTRNADYTDMMVRPVIERISSEITRSIQFFQENAGQKVDAVFLTGGSAGLPALKTQIEAAVPLPIRLIDPFAGLTFRDAAVKDFAEKHKCRLAVAVGLALDERMSISLLPRPVRMARRAADIVPAVLTLLFVAGFLPLVMGVILRSVEIQGIKPNIRASKKTLEQAAVQGQRIAELQDRVQKQTDTSRSLQALTVREPLWAGVLNTLSQAVPRDVVLTRLSTSLSPAGVATVNLSGRVLPSSRNFDDAVSAFLSELSASVFFASVHVANAAAGGDDSKQGSFEIHCELMY